MFETLLITFLFSISPFGEARVGIPYAILNDVHFIWAFLVGLIANLLVYPLMMWLIDTFNIRLWPYPAYKKSVIKLSRMAKRSAGSKIEKYGFWGLMIFVMIPLPGTGAYMGAIAASIFKIDRKQAFWAISIGIFISCILMAVGSHLSNLGLSMF